MRTSVQIAQAKKLFSSGKFRSHKGVKTRFIIYGMTGFKRCILPSDEPELMACYRLVCKQKIDGQMTTCVVITTKSVEEVVERYMHAIRLFTTGMGILI